MCHVFADHCKDKCRNAWKFLSLSAIHASRICWSSWQEFGGLEKKRASIFCRVCAWPCLRAFASGCSRSSSHATQCTWRCETTILWPLLVPLYHAKRTVLICDCTCWRTMQGSTECFHKQLWWDAFFTLYVSARHSSDCGDVRTSTTSSLIFVVHLGAWDMLACNHMCKGAIAVICARVRPALFVFRYVNVREWNLSAWIRQASKRVCCMYVVGVFGCKDEIWLCWCCRHPGYGLLFLSSSACFWQVNLIVIIMQGSERRAAISYVRLVGLQFDQQGSDHGSDRDHWRGGWDCARCLPSRAWKIDVGVTGVQSNFKALEVCVWFKTVA